MDFTPVKEAEVMTFLTRARKGLRYGEELFLGIFTYQDDKTPLDLIDNFFQNLLKIDADKRPYGKFLLKKNLMADLRNRITMPRFIDNLEEVSKEQVYRILTMHIPASDLFDLIGSDLATRIYRYKIIKTEGMYVTSEESGNTINIFLRGKELAVFHTIFT
ncbi:MAG: hypothetical protein ABIJ21_09190 [Nanoarchaeota archaeon]